MTQCSISTFHTPHVPILFHRGHPVPVVFHLFREDAPSCSCSISSLRISVHSLHSKLIPTRSCLWNSKILEFSNFRLRWILQMSCWCKTFFGTAHAESWHSIPRYSGFETHQNPLTLITGLIHLRELTPAEKGMVMVKNRFNGRIERF
jgi:hypothetical protein